MKRGTVWQIVRFISHFSLKLYIQFWKYFHSTILGRLSRSCCKKNYSVKILGQNFCLGCLSAVKSILCLTFIFYQKYFYDKMNLRFFYFRVTKYPKCWLITIFCMSLQNYLWKVVSTNQTANCCNIQKQQLIGFVQNGCSGNKELHHRYILRFWDWQAIIDPLSNISILFSTLQNYYKISWSIKLILS